MSWRSTGFAVSIVVVASLSCILPANSQSGLSDLKQEWWMQQKTPAKNFKPSPPVEQREEARSQSTADTTFKQVDLNGSTSFQGAKHEGTFVVPNYFSAQPAPFERPPDIIVPKYGSFAPMPGLLGLPGLPLYGRAPLGMQTQVLQIAPSKASGNYFAPSNVDTSASGSYYATGAPAMTPTMPPREAPKDYWGQGGNPFAK